MILRADKATKKQLAREEDDSNNNSIRDDAHQANNDDDDDDDAQRQKQQQQQMMLRGNAASVEPKGILVVHSNDDGFRPLLERAREQGFLAVSVVTDDDDDILPWNY